MYWAQREVLAWCPFCTGSPVSVGWDSAEVGLDWCQPSASSLPGLGFFLPSVSHPLEPLLVTWASHSSNSLREALASERWSGILNPGNDASILVPCAIGQSSHRWSHSSRRRKTQVWICGGMVSWWGGIFWKLPQVTDNPGKCWMQPRWPLEYCCL